MTQRGLKEIILVLEARSVFAMYSPQYMGAESVELGSIILPVAVGM